MDREVWKSTDSLGYPDYCISNYGRILNMRLEKFVEGGYDEKRGCYVFLTNEQGKGSSIKTNKLVASLFVPKEKNGLRITHKDGDNKNIRADNLEWKSCREISLASRNRKYKGNPIYQLDDNKDIIKRWKNRDEAANAFKTQNRNITAAIMAKHKCCGYYWEYCHKIDKEDENLVWKKVKIERYESLFVSNKGDIKSKNGRPRKPTESNLGYFKVRLTSKSDEYKQKHIEVHRLVALGFLGEPENDKIEVNHIDGNKGNNTIDNLEYVTPSQNTQHSINTGLRTLLKRGKRVAEINRNGNIIRRFDNAKEASISVGVITETVRKVCKGHRKQIHGRRFIYTE